MQPFRLASGGTLLTETHKLPVTGLVNSDQARSGMQIPKLQGPNTRLIAPKQPVQPIVEDPTGRGVTQLSNVLLDSAFKFDDRLAQIDADEAALSYRDKARNLFNGTPGEDGSLTGGYGNTRNRDAMTEFKSYKDSIKALEEETLQGLNGYARSKALLRIKAASEDYINQGVSHYQREVRNQEKNLIALEGESIQKDIADRGSEPFNNGQVQSYISRIPDAVQGQRELEGLVLNGMYSAYNKALAEAHKDVTNLNPNATAIQAASDFYNKIQHTVPPEIDNKAIHWMENQLNVAEHKDKLNDTERKKNLRQTIKSEAPQYFADSIQTQNYEELNNHMKMYRSAFDNPEEGSDHLVKAVKESVFTQAMARGGVTYNEQKVFVQKELTNILKNTDLDPIEAGQIMNLAQSEIPKMLHEAHNREDQDELNDQALRWAKLRTRVFKPGDKLDGEDMPYTSPNPAMLPENVVKWHKLQEDYEKATADDSKGTLSGHTPDKAQGMYLVYRDAIRDGQALTDDQMNKLREYLSEQSITQTQFAEIQKLNKSVSSVSERKPAFMKTEEYKAVLDVINKSDAIFAGSAKPKAGKTKDKIKAMYEWEDAAEIGKARFRNELEEANKKAIEAGKPFSPHDWMRDQIRIKINNGSLATPPSMFMQWLDDKWDGAKATITGEKASIMEDLESN